MAKNKKVKSKWYLWLLLILLLVFGGFFLLGGSIGNFGFASQTQLPEDETPAGTSGGSSGGTNEEPTDTDFSWFDFPDFDFDLPCFWNCDDGADETTPETSTPKCVKNADCMNICSNPNTATCVNGECNCGIPTPITSFNCYETDEEGRGDPDEIYVKGTCYESIASRGITDSCRANTLTEYYCRTDTACSSYTVDCQAEYGTDWGCLDGACVALL